MMNIIIFGIVMLCAVFVLIIITAMTRVIVRSFFEEFFGKRAIFTLIYEPISCLLLDIIMVKYRGDSIDEVAMNSDVNGYKEMLLKISSYIGHESLELFDFYITLMSGGVDRVYSDMLHVLNDKDILTNYSDSRPEARGFRLIYLYSFMSSSSEYSAISEALHLYEIYLTFIKTDIKWYSIPNVFEICGSLFPNLIFIIKTFFKFNKRISSNERFVLNRLVNYYTGDIFNFSDDEIMENPERCIKKVWGIMFSLNNMKDIEPILDCLYDKR